MKLESAFEKQLIDYIENNQGQIVSFLQKLISHPTITPQYHQSAKGQAYKNLQDEVKSLLHQIGVEQIDIWEQDASELENFPGAGIYPGRDLSNMPILAAKIEGTGGGRSLILNGHYDVVPIGDADLWSIDPFAGEVAKGKIFGRGSCDMKGGIAAMLLALKFLHDLDIRLKGDVNVQTVPDEEMTCMGTLACCQRGYVADAAFIPEPTDMKILIAMRGSKYGRIDVRGRAGHAEMPHPDWTEGGAVNPITKAQIVLQAIEELNQKWLYDPAMQHRVLPPNTVVPVKIQSDGDWSVTFPDEVRINFGIMIQPSFQNGFEEFQEYILDAAKKDSWLKNNPPKFIYEGSFHYGAEIDESEPIVDFAKIILEDLNYAPETCGFGSLTDAIHLINFSKIPTISIGPALQPAHMVDEYIQIIELVDLTKVIALMLVRWCGVENVT